MFKYLNFFTVSAPNKLVIADLINKSVHHN